MSGSGSSKLTGNDVVGLSLLGAFIMAVGAAVWFIAVPFISRQLEPTPTPAVQMVLRESSNPDLIAECVDGRTLLREPGSKVYVMGVLDTVRVQRLMTDDQFRNSQFDWAWSEADGLEYEVRSPVGTFQFGVRCLSDTIIVFSYVEKLPLE